jgi:hypothetical protein
VDGCLQLRKAGGGVDIVAHNRFAGFNVTGEEGLDALAQKRPPEGRFSPHALADRFLEISGQCHFITPVFRAVCNPARIESRP